jgi:hypothetical protein
LPFEFDFEGGMGAFLFGGPGGGGLFGGGPGGTFFFGGGGGGRAFGGGGLGLVTGGPGGGGGRTIAAATAIVFGWSPKGAVLLGGEVTAFVIDLLLKCKCNYTEKELTCVVASPKA